MTCHDLDQLLDDHIDGHLAPPIVASMHRHTRLCERCAGHVRTYCCTVDMVRASFDHAADAPVPSALLDRLLAIASH